MEKGYYTIRGCHNNNTCRLNNASRQNSDSLSIRRKLLRGKRKSKGDKNLQIEVLLYGAGSF